MYISGEFRGHFLCFFFFNDTATTEIYTLSLHDALPISACAEPRGTVAGGTCAAELYAAAPDGKRNGDVAPGWQERRWRSRWSGRGSRTHWRARTRRKETGDGPAANPRPRTQDSNQH